MAEQSTPKKHEVGLTLSDAGMARAAALLARQGHNSLQRMIARGLELVEWVEDQQEQGRIICSVVYGDSNSDISLRELQERPDLLGGRAPLHVPAPVQPVEKAPVEVASVEQQEPTPVEVDAPEPAPAAPVAESPAPSTSLPESANPKLVPRPKVAPAPKPAPRTSRGENRRMAVANAHRHSDDGPVKTLNWVRWDCERKRRTLPICYDGKPLPGALTLEHKEQLIAALNPGYGASHFLIAEDGFVIFYEFVLRKGWHTVLPGTPVREFDPNMNSGLGCIYPVQLAVSYLNDLEGCGLLAVSA